MVAPHIGIRDAQVLIMHQMAYGVDPQGNKEIPAKTERRPLQLLLEAMYMTQKDWEERLENLRMIKSKK